MRKWSWIALAAMAVVASLAITVAVLEGNHRRSLARQVKEQSVVIDSLLARDLPLLDVKLYVTDRSVNKIYGRYNRGYINMPQERRYILVVDSANTTLKSINNH